jgi:anaerobic ribonucleoside-triphosphate reductase
MNINQTNTGVGAGTKFNRIRRITGYINADLSRFNNAKFAEVRDRVKHAVR